MKTIYLILVMVLAGTACFADSPSNEAVQQESLTIIDPDLMNQDTWAEPYFPSAEELAREPSSAPKETVKNADEYLDVVKVIPASEPTVSRAWLEYKILREE